MNTGLKTKNRLIHQECKEEPFNLSDMPPLEGDKEEVNKGN